MTTLKPDTVLVRVNSHRAGDKLTGLIGKLQYYYSMRHPGYIAECPTDLLDAAKQIKGISVARINPDEWMRCWNA